MPQKSVFTLKVILFYSGPRNSQTVFSEINKMWGKNETLAFNTQNRDAGAERHLTTKAEEMLS